MPLFPPRVLSGAHGSPRQAHEAPQNVRRVCLNQIRKHLGMDAGPRWCVVGPGVLTRLLSPSSSSPGMRCPLRLLLLALLLASACGTLSQRGRRDDGGGESESAEPRWGRLKSGNASRPLPPAAFHEENTVTNEWIAEGEEEEDYLDLDRILGEDDDYSDVVDAAPPTRPGAGTGSVLPLFPGKSRVQRLNLLNAQFAFDLYRELAARAGAADNIFLAPVGVSAAMAMLSLGLAGDTHQQVHTALRFAEFVNASATYELGTIHNLFRKLTHRLFRRDFGYTLRSVSGLYVQKQLPVVDDFKAKVREYYFAEVRAADFSDPAFLAHTNQHVARLTKGLIRDALQDVDPATQMLLLNCIYFKGRRRHSPPGRPRGQGSGQETACPRGGRAGRAAGPAASASTPPAPPNRARLRAACGAREGPREKACAVGLTAAVSGRCCPSLHLTDTELQCCPEGCLAPPPACVRPELAPFSASGPAGSQFTYSLSGRTKGWR